MVRGEKPIIFILISSKIAGQSFNVCSATAEHILLYSYLYKHICAFTSGIKVINCTGNGELICSVKNTVSSEWRNGSDLSKTERI